MRYDIGLTRPIGGCIGRLNSLVHRWRETEEASLLP